MPAAQGIREFLALPRIIRKNSYLNKNLVKLTKKRFINSPGWIPGFLLIADTYPE